ncbi:uncharacterized protein LOC119549866 [Drosophila subpulchrella]|uniref:uncharacterized protein LOC119549866 n=1 Tax=Drosophila subpulchrella TaxID=1486046 RepID=UPI0018A167F4|nr:uncharacterized protein LOC119549866 [Drosophila subpulchrella]
MKRCLVWKWILLIIFEVVNLSMQIEYQFELEDESIYTNCSNVQPGTLNINGLFDMTHLSTIMKPEGIELSGNMTSVFNAQPSDRIEVTGNLFYFDRGTWQPTTLNMAIKDFCKVMYDEKQLWYKEWAARVTNKDVIKDNCIKEHGTVFLMETYTIKLRFGSSMPLVSGRYTLRIRVFAIDQSGKKRPNDVCYEVKGTFFKI